MTGVPIDDCTLTTHMWFVYVDPTDKLLQLTYGVVLSEDLPPTWSRRLQSRIWWEGGPDAGAEKALEVEGLLMKKIDHVNAERARRHGWPSTGEIAKYFRSKLPPWPRPTAA